MTQISRFHENVMDITRQEEVWRKGWKHRKPCDEWNLNIKLYGRGFCKHYAMARYRHFKKEIDSLFEVKDWDGKINKWVYISDKR